MEGDRHLPILREDYFHHEEEKTYTYIYKVYICLARHVGLYVCLGHIEGVSVGRSQGYFSTDNDAIADKLLVNSGLSLG